MSNPYNTIVNTIGIFIWVYAAMIAMSFWESSVEGRKTWDQGKFGWKIKIGNYCFPEYHFFVFIIMWPILLSLPLIISGWDLKLAGILASAYFSGIVVEDLMWHVVNPAVSFKESFNSKFSNYYPWIRLGNFEIPFLYLLGALPSLLIWYFIWK